MGPVLQKAVDVRRCAIARAIGTSLTNVFSSTESSRNPGDVVRIWPRVFAVVGGEAPSLQHVSQCTRRECGDVRHSDFGHGDALDGNRYCERC